MFTVPTLEKKENVRQMVDLLEHNFHNFKYPKEIILGVDFNVGNYLTFIVFISWFNIFWF